MSKNSALTIERNLTFEASTVVVARRRGALGDDTVSALPVGRLNRCVQDVDHPAEVTEISFRKTLTCSSWTYSVRQLASPVTSASTARPSIYLPPLYVNSHAFGRVQSFPFTESSTRLPELMLWFLIQFAEAIAALVYWLEPETEAR